VTTSTASDGPMIRPGFVGLSMEYPTVEDYAGTDPFKLDPMVEQLIRNLHRLAAQCPRRTVASGIGADRRVAGNQRDHGVNELGVLHAKQLRGPAASRCAEHSDPVGIDLRLGLHPEQRPGEVLKPVPTVR